MKIGEDGFITVPINASAGDVIEALDSIEEQGYHRPRYLLVQNLTGEFAGIVLAANIDWAEMDDMLSDMEDLKVHREQISLDATDAEKIAAIKASGGLALGMRVDKPVVILRQAELGFDARLPVGRSGLPEAPGATKCPHCTLVVTQYHSLPRLERDKVIFERLCPHCDRVISVG